MNNLIKKDSELITIYLRNVAYYFLCIYLVVFVFNNNNLLDSPIPRLFMVSGIIGISVIEIETLLWNIKYKDELFDLGRLFKNKIILGTLRMMNLWFIFSKYVFTVLGSFIGAAVYIRCVQVQSFMDYLRFIAIIIVFLYSLKRLFNYLSKL